MLPEGVPPQPARRRRDAARRPAHEASDDVDETVNWCESCGETRRFVKRRVDVSRLEAEADVPSILQAIEGEIGWVCAGCGEFHRDLIAEDAYAWEHSDVGYTVPQFPDDEASPREASSEGSDPPERLEERGPATPGGPPGAADRDALDFAVPEEPPPGTPRPAGPGSRRPGKEPGPRRVRSR